MDRRRKLTISAAVALTLWLLAVLGAVLWLRPRFWVQPHERFQRAEAMAQQGRAAEALASVDVALQKDPANAGYLVFKGHRQLDLGRPADAERTFREALKVMPSHVDARLGLATALTRQGKRESAVAALQSLSPETIGAAQLRRRSQLYAALGARELAREDLALLLQQKPNDPQLLQEAAGLAVADRDWGQAASLSSRLRAAADDAQVRVWAANTRAEALQAAGKLPEALEAYRDADSDDRLETRAALALSLRRYVEAAELFDALARAHPSEPRFRRSRAFALHIAGRGPDAERAFRALIVEGAADLETRTTYAWLLNTQHRYAEAWNILEPLPRPARDPELLELQARTALWAHRADDAVHLVRALVELRPNDAELWKRLADAWSMAGNEGQAADALRTYVRLQSQDWPARRRLADILARLGSLDAAIEEYRTLVAADPDNPELLRALGVVEETAGDLQAAAATYLRAVKQAPDPELYMRLARLHRWTGHHDVAVGWYEKYLASTPDPAARRQAESELTVSLLESGDPTGSLARIAAAAGRRPLDAAELTTAARAATATADPRAAIRYLELLADTRALTDDEGTWLAGQYRAAGRTEDALAAYERLAGRGRSDEDRLLEAVGDLRYDGGDFAGAVRAFQRIGGADVSLKIARAAARTGQLAVAREAYERHLRTHPDDTAARLAAARYYASAGDSKTAIARYQEVAALVGAADLRLEIARAHLGAEMFAEAERWARQALAAGEEPDESRLALAQSLHLQGRVREADALLAELTRSARPPAEALTWRIHVAAALDRHLDAYRSAGRALATGADRGDRLLLWMSASARSRGDYARARDAHARAAAQNASPAEVHAAASQLRTATRPTLSVPGWAHADSNELRLSAEGAGLMMFLPSLVGSMSVEVLTGTVEQRGFSTRRHTIAVALDHLFPTPELRLAFGAGFDRYDRARDLFNWRAMGTYHFGDDSAFGAVASRNSLLPSGRQSELRHFNRVLDIAALGPSFHVHEVQGFVESVMRRDRRLRVEAGANMLEDGNRRLFSYMHYQVPLATGVRRWAVLRPNAFFETFRDERGPYFSPGRHLTVGAMLHAIQRSSRWQLELEVNPQWLRTQGSNGFGIHGLTNVVLRMGRTSVSGGAFIFYDALEDYLQGRVSGRVSILVGR